MNSQQRCRDTYGVVVGCCSVSCFELRNTGLSDTSLSVKINVAYMPSSPEASVIEIAGGGNSRSGRDHFHID
jgi:hypothetical protein